MIINTESIKQVTNKILAALDTSEHTILTDTLEISAKDKVLYFNVTNKEYYVQISIPIEADDNFRATVNANMFLKLISQITTEQVEFTIVDKALVVEGNGKFKIPLMLAFDQLLELPELTIDSVTQKFYVNNDILQSIITYNMRELNGKTFNDVIRTSYYLDDKGCITFTSGACVNNFSLDKPIKLILSNKIVKLFKLFNDESVLFELGFNQVGETIQTRIRLSDSSVLVSAITYSNDNLLAKFPVNAIRERVTKIYPYNVSIGRIELMQALNRFIIFSNYDVNNSECTFTFVDDNLIIENNTGDIENIKLSTSIGNTYKAHLDLFNLKSIIETSHETMVNLSFGDNTAFVITRGPINNLLPECE